MSQKDARYTARSLIMTAIATLLVTIGTLEFTGRIDHSDNKDNVPIGDFKAIHIKPGEPFRMSPKPSELHATCEQGFLAIAADANPSFRGILVDYKNRGVRCTPGGATPAHDRPVKDGSSDSGTGQQEEKG